MKSKFTLALASVAAVSIFSTQQAQAQTEVSVTEVIETQNLPCKTNYFSTSSDNWFIQLGAGVDMPVVENKQPGGTSGRSLTASYNVAVGKWFTPYVGWRLSFFGGAIHWNNLGFSKAKYVSGNLDFMWDMFNSFGGVNSSRPFSIIPFVGLGGAFTWDFDAPAGNTLNRHEQVKRNQWTLPVSAGLQFRFRLCRYVDFFLEARGQFHGDNWNNYVVDAPVDFNFTATGGLTFNIGGSNFKSYNPCDYVAYINSLNNQINDLRGALSTTQAKLASAEAQLLELYTPTGQLYATRTSAGGKMGTYAFDFPTEQDAATGSWSAKASVGGASFEKRLRIETIKPNRLLADFVVEGAVFFGFIEVGRDQVDCAGIEGVTACVVAGENLIHSLLHAFVVFEFENVDVFAGEHLQVAPSFVAMALGKRRRAAEHGQQERHGAVCRLVVVLIREILQQSAHTLHETLRSPFNEVHLEEGETERTERVLYLGNIERK